MSYYDDFECIGMVMPCSFSYAPVNWMFCQGQELQIEQFIALFSLLGTNYGGDGRYTFKVPDLRGRIPVGAGQGPGLSSRPLGVAGGRESRTFMTGAFKPADANNSVPALVPGGAGPDASSGELETMPPFLTINYIICHTGYYPSRD